MRYHLSWRTTYSWQVIHCNWTCHQRPPVLRDHMFMANRVILQDRFYCMYLTNIYLSGYTECNIRLQCCSMLFWIVHCDKQILRLLNVFIFKFQPWQVCRIGMISMLCNILHLQMSFCGVYLKRDTSFPGNDFFLDIQCDSLVPYIYCNFFYKCFIILFIFKGL